MTSIVKSIIVDEVGVDQNLYLTASKGIKVPEVWVGPSGSETQWTGGGGIPPLGPTLTSAGGVLNTTQPVNAQIGTSYAIATTDTGELVTFNNASAVAVSLSVATTSGFGAGFSFAAQNIGVGPVTITPTTSTINGGTTLVLQENEGAQITSDGVNYQVSASTIKTPLSGTFAAKPSSPTTGMPYYATDLNIMIFYNGTKWKPMGGVGVIYQSGAQTALHTGDTTETNVTIVTIPAGLLSVNGGLRITMQDVKTGANATCTWAAYLSATSGGTNGTMFYQLLSSAAAKLAESATRTIWNRGADQSHQVSQGLTNAGIGESTNTSLTMAINSANAMYLNFTAKPGSALDTVGFDAITVEWLEA